MGLPVGCSSDEEDEGPTGLSGAPTASDLIVHGMFPSGSSQDPKPASRSTSGRLASTSGGYTTPAARSSAEFKFSPSKHEPTRYDSPEFRFSPARQAAVSRSHSLSEPEAPAADARTPSLLRHRSAAANLTRPDDSVVATLPFAAAVGPMPAAGVASHLPLNSSLTVATSLGEPQKPEAGSPVRESGSPSSSMGALPLTPESDAQAHRGPLGLGPLPLPLPLSPAHRHPVNSDSGSRPSLSKTSASSTSSHQPSLPPRHNSHDRASEDGGSPPPMRSLAHLEKDTIALAAGTVTVALAANAAVMGADGSSPEQVVQRTWDWLAEQPEDAAELAALLFEATPRLGVAAARSPKLDGRTSKQRRASQGSVPLLERLAAAQPMPAGVGDMDWSLLSLVCGSELLRFEETAAALAALELSAEQSSPVQSSGGESRARSPSPGPSPRGDLVEINSGGQVLFCFFAPPSHAPFAPETVLVAKFHASRLTTQSEQFANELTRHLGICAPFCRILRQQGATQDEWRQALEAARALGKPGAVLEEQMAHSTCMLLMECIPGPALFDVPRPLEPDQIHQTAEDLGRLFVLDMLLGNPDRLACETLGWRGNPQNLRYCDRGPFQGRMVAIDSVVQRRPPGNLVSKEDAACSRLVELMLNDLTFAGGVLREAVGCCQGAAEPLQDRDICRAFQASLRNSLEAIMQVKGLLEMMFEVLSDWIQAFISDMEGLEAGDGGTPPASRGGTPPHSGNTTPRGQIQTTPTGQRWGGTSPTQQTMCTTQKIKSIGREARQNQLISERLSHWKATMRERGEELRAALEEWQVKQAGDDSAPRLTTGFLDGTHPVVDIYELKVRLEHMLQRLRALKDAAATARPTQLLPYLYVSGAVEASSLHVLRHLGITRLLNATEDLLQPESVAGFQCVRCSIRDEEEVDIKEHFQAAFEFIEAAKAAGEAVLVHCHEGKSRSVTLVLAYLMQSQEWTFKEALEFVSAARPQASPNAGFMARLLELDQKLHGKRTVKVKRTKPELRVCPVCEEKVGISAQSLALHVKKQHPEAIPALEANHSRS